MYVIQTVNKILSTSKDFNSSLDCFHSREPFFENIQNEQSHLKVIWGRILWCVNSCYYFCQEASLHIELLAD